MEGNSCASRWNPLNIAVGQCSEVLEKLQNVQFQSLTKWKRELAINQLSSIFEYLLQFQDFKLEDLGAHRDLLYRTWSGLSEFDEIFQRMTTSDACESSCSSIHVPSLPFLECMYPGVDSNDLDRGIYNIDLLKEEISHAIHAVSLKQSAAISAGHVHAAAAASHDQRQHKVGVDFRLGKLLECVADGRISVVAIVGEGGLGKTNLLEAAVDTIAGTGDYVVAAIAIGRDQIDVLGLQWQVIRQLGGGQKKPPRNPEQGKRGMRMMMRMLKEQGRRVCLAIDNVQQASYLQEIFPDNLPELIPASTCLFVTTRSEAVAHDFLQKLFNQDTACHSSEISFFLHRPARLTHLESLDLFAFYATKSQGALEEKHRSIADLVVNACAGLPLALILLGCYFDLGKNRKKSAWIYASQKLQIGEVMGKSEQLIFAILDMVFESLQSQDLQESFLDVVLFFHGQDWNTIQYSVGRKILEDLAARHLIVPEFNYEAVAGKRNIDRLSQRICHIESSSSFHVVVHDLIYEFAKNKSNGDRSDLLISAAADMPSAGDSQMVERVKGISLMDCKIEGNQLEQMLSLKYLSLKDVSISGPEIQRLSERLVFISWKSRSQGRKKKGVSSLPMNNMEHLNVLHLHASKGEINVVNEI